MAKQLCEPTTLFEPCDTPPALCTLNDKAYKVGVAILQAAKWCIACADLDCFDREDIQLGVPHSNALCCNHIAVGITPGIPERDGSCWSSFPVNYELLISRCQPHIENKTLPVAGELNGCTPNSISQHSLYMLRHLEAITKHLSKCLCCFIDEDQCPSCCAEGIYIARYEFDTDSECSELRIILEPPS